MQPTTIITGNLTADPELRYLDSGRAVANFSIALDRGDVAHRQAGRAGDELALHVGDLGVHRRLPDQVPQRGRDPELIDPFVGCRACACSILDSALPI